MESVLTSPMTGCQSRDSNFTYLHFSNAKAAELFEEFCRDKLPNDGMSYSLHSGEL